MKTTAAAIAPLRSKPLRVVSVLVLGVALATPACKSSDAQPAQSPCKQGIEGEVETGLKTGVQGAKTGVETGVEGVKTAGSAGVGLVQGGTDKGKANWNEGKAETRETAHEGAAQTKKQAHTPKCR